MGTPILQVMQLEQHQQEAALQQELAAVSLQQEVAALRAKVAALQVGGCMRTGCCLTEQLSLPGGCNTHFTRPESAALIKIQHGRNLAAVDEGPSGGGLVWT